MIWWQTGGDRLATAEGTRKAPDPVAETRSGAMCSITYLTHLPSWQPYEGEERTAANHAYGMSEFLFKILQWSSPI